MPGRPASADEADDASRRDGFENANDLCFYETCYLDMRRHHRRDPGFYDEALARGLIADPHDPDGGCVLDNHGAVLDAPWGCHPFYDYGYERRLGKGRVLWDELRPALWAAVQRVMLDGVVWYWRQVAAESAMRPISLGGPYDAAAAAAAEMPDVFG